MVGSLTGPRTLYLQPRIFGVTSGDQSTRTRSVGAGGASGGFFQLKEFIEDFERDYVVAPREYLGNLLTLGPTARPGVRSSPRVSQRSHTWG